MTGPAGAESKPRSSRLFEAVGGMPAGIVRLAILEGLGIDAEDLLGRPLVAVVNSWTEITPGHTHLDRLARAVKEGVWAAGGVPLEFGVIAPCDGYGNGNEGMRYTLASRELIADSVEAMMRGHSLDAMVTLSTCDKVNPGMLMAAARLDVPTVCVTGGANIYEVTFTPQHDLGINPRAMPDLDGMRSAITCATCGSCEIMGTANTMQCLMEALGMALPGSGATPAVHSDKLRQARRAGRRVVELIREDLRPSAILTREAFENAIALDMAIGGSTNTTLHLPAIAHELGIDLELGLFDAMARRVPTLVGVYPNGNHGMLDLFRAGGVSGVLSRLEELLHADCLTVSGETIGELARRGTVRDSNVIRPLDDPLLPEGGTAVLVGSLAPEGAVVKQSAVVPEARTFEGPARVFEDEEEALAAATGGELADGTVVVLRYQGPRGAPGMPELLMLTVVLELAANHQVALVTDGRFSGASGGPVIGHVSPEAAVGGPIAHVRDGDLIRIDVQNRSLDLLVGPAELAARGRDWQPRSREVPRGYLHRYRTLVGSAARGAVLGEA